MKELIAKVISKEIGIDLEEIKKAIEIPPNQNLGDFAFPCFTLAKKMKKNPNEIAKELAEKINKKKPKEISNVSHEKGYINFSINKIILAEETIKESQKDDFGENSTGRGKTICIDMSSPNIAKPFGIGHLRSTIIGNSISKILKANGYKVIRINYLGDWGTQFGKLILAYKKWGNEKKLQESPIEHLQELYVRINQDESLEEEARNEFKKLEEGDKENLKLWKKFKDLSLKSFEEIYEILGVSFEEIDGESNYKESSKEVIIELEKKGLLKEDDGAKIVDLRNENLGVVLIQKNDGTSLYATRDIAAAIKRKKKYEFNKMIYEVGQEQTLHFKQVFRVLELMGHSWAKDCIHISHGLYLDSDGKKFSTRKGKTIYMKDIIREVIEKAKEKIKKELSKKEIETRARKIAIAAIIYGDLKNNRENNVVFDADKFLSFEGDTGPYLLYSYARANSITKKAKSKSQKIKINELQKEEIELIKKISEYPEIVIKASENLAPNIIANYSFELAKCFNEFYHSCPVLNTENESFRINLVISFKKTLKKSLNLLGIDVLEEM